MHFCNDAPTRGLQPVAEQGQERVKVDPIVRGCRDEGPCRRSGGFRVAELAAVIEHLVRARNVVVARMADAEDLNRQ